MPFSPKSLVFIAIVASFAIIGNMIALMMAGQINQNAGE